LIAAPHARNRPVSAHGFDIVASAVLHCIPDGLYDAVGGRAHRPRAIFGTLKLYVPFTVLVPSPESLKGLEQMTLFRHYNVKNAPDRRFQVRPTSDYWREWVLAAGHRPSRHDRLSPYVFERVLFSVEIRTVTRDHRQHALPPGGRYSVVARIVERKTGAGVL
jgi:hypothetical protein